jgi:hypothetical protein
MDQRTPRGHTIFKEDNMDGQDMLVQIANEAGLLAATVIGRTLKVAEAIAQMYGIEIEDRGLILADNMNLTLYGHAGPEKMPKALVIQILCGEDAKKALEVSKAEYERPDHGEEN